MRNEPNFDDPSRTADYGFFASEGMGPVVITGDDMAYAITTGIPISAPMSEWLPKLTEGWIYELSPADTRAVFKAMLAGNDTYQIAMDILNDVAYENYGG